MLSALLAGLLCGFFGSVPVAGPTAVLVVERAMSGRPRAAFEIAAGAAVAETAYALLAYLGMTAFLSEFPRLVIAIRILAVAILVAVGLYLAVGRRHPPAAVDPDVPAPRGKRGAMILLGLVMTGMNPTLLASWSAVVTVLHSTATLRVEPLDALPFALAVGAGSAAWFALLVWFLHRFHRKLRPETVGRVVKGVGWIMVVAGGYLAAQLVRSGLT